MTGARSLRSLVVAVLVCFAATPASAFKKCRTADGKLLFTDVPPAGCVVEGEIPNAPRAPEPETPAGEPSAGDVPVAGDAPAGGSFDAQAIATRRRIERALAGAADDLAALARERANAPRLPAGAYVDTRSGEGSYQDGASIDPQAEAAIRAREDKVKERIQALRDEDAAVTAKLAESNGGSLPSWWSPAPRCEGCP